MAEVEKVFRCIAHRLPMRAVEEIEAVVNRGLAGCAHAQPGGLRQILLMDAETLEEVGLRPGEVKENITTRGLNVRELRGRRGMLCRVVAGGRIRAGDSILALEYERVGE